MHQQQQLKKGRIKFASPFIYCCCCCIFQARRKWGFKTYNSTASVVWGSGEKTFSISTLNRSVYRCLTNIIASNGCCRLVVVVVVRLILSRIIENMPLFSSRKHAIVLLWVLCFHAPANTVHEAKWRASHIVAHLADLPSWYCAWTVHTWKSCSLFLKISK